MNRRAVLLAVLAAIPASARLAPVSGKPSQAARRGQGGLTASAVRIRTVTRTFTSTVPITIPVSAATTPYPSTIRVSGLRHGRILRVRVSLIGLTHSFPNNLDIMVVAPGNKGVILMSDVGGATDVAGATLHFDQNAGQRVPDILVSGTFQPANLPLALDPFPAPAPAGVSSHSLLAFNNRNPNGIWRLFVTDDFLGADGGSIAGWRLQITARVRVNRRRRRGANRRPRRRAKR